MAVAATSHGREGKLATKHVPTGSDIADIGTKGLTSYRIWKLMNQMGMSLVAGVECLVQQPMEKTTETSILDRGISLCTRYGKPERARNRVVMATALKPWRGLRARDLRCSDEVVGTTAIETMRNSCV